MDVGHEAADDALNDAALLPDVSAEDIAALLVGDVLVAAAAGEHIGHHLVYGLGLLGVGGAGEAGAGGEEDDCRGENDSDGDEKFLSVHFPAPPFMTPKRLTGRALSSAQAQAFMSSIA